MPPHSGAQYPKSESDRSLPNGYYWAITVRPLFVPIAAGQVPGIMTTGGGAGWRKVGEAVDQLWA